MPMSEHIEAISADDRNACGAKHGLRFNHSPIMLIKSCMIVRHIPRSLRWAST